MMSRWSSDDQQVSAVTNLCPYSRNVIHVKILTKCGLENGRVLILVSGVAILLPR